MTRSSPCHPESPTRVCPLRFVQPWDVVEGSLLTAKFMTSVAGARKVPSANAATFRSNRTQREILRLRGQACRTSARHKPPGHVAQNDGFVLYHLPPAPKWCSGTSNDIESPRTTRSRRHPAGERRQTLGRGPGGGTCKRRLEVPNAEPLRVISLHLALGWAFWQLLRSRLPRLLSGSAEAAATSAVAAAILAGAEVTALLLRIRRQHIQLRRQSRARIGRQPRRPAQFPVQLHCTDLLRARPERRVSLARLRPARLRPMRAMKMPRAT